MELLEEFLAIVKKISSFYQFLIELLSIFKKMS